MSTALFYQAAAGLLSFSLLLPHSASAESPEQTVPYEVLYAPTREIVSPDAARFESTPVVQEVPSPSRVWLDGRVSFVGGELSSSERQHAYAEAHNIPIMRSESEYQTSIQSGHFVLLQHPHLEVGARRPYVLPTTAAVIYDVAEGFARAGCGQLRINDATRLTTERPVNGSPFSVHPAGMALDLRVNNLSEHCYNSLANLLHEEERAGRADVTREYKPPHFHVVVVPEQRVRRVFMGAQYEQMTDTDQGE